MYNVSYPIVAPHNPLVPVPLQQPVLPAVAATAVPVKGAGMVQPRWHIDANTVSPPPPTRPTPLTKTRAEVTGWHAPLASIPCRVCRHPHLPIPRSPDCACPAPTTLG